MWGVCDKREDDWCGVFVTDKCSINSELSITDVRLSLWTVLS